MEYLTNGDFENGKLEPWQSVGTPISVVEEDGEYHAQLSAGGKLNQRFTIADVQPRRFSVAVELRVSGGSDEAEGKVQLIWSANLSIKTFNLVESSDWTTVTIPVNLSSVTSTNNVEVLVQPRFDKVVSVRSVSVTDQL